MITLITGGHGSGKTARAIDIAKSYPTKLYIATSEIIDSEIAGKVEIHKKERDSTYTTVEEPIELAKAIQNNLHVYPIIIVDCLTVWLGNLQYYKKDIDKFKHNLCSCLVDKGSSYNISADVVLITNESTLSVIASDAETRLYLKQLAQLNKDIATIAKNVELMISGINVKIK